MRIGIRLTAFLAAFILITGCGCSAAAIGDVLSDPLKQAASEIEIPSDIQTEFGRIGIETDKPESLLTLSPEELLRGLLRTAAQEAAAPLRLCGVLMTLTVLCTLLGNFADAAADGALRRIFDALCTLLCIGTAAAPLCDILIRTAKALDTGHTFMTGFIPIFGAFIAAGGNVASGTAYQVCVLFLTESIMQLLHGILFPILQMSAALGITDAVNQTLRLSGFVSGLRTAVTWILGFIMTMFSALLSVRSIVASAADSLASRSVRLLASGLIPIVGNAVSDAYGTVQGSIRLLRNGVGAVGILVILWLVLPPLISLCIYRMIFHINSIFAEMAGAKPLAQLFRNTQAVLSAAFAILVCFAVMMIVSSAAVLLLIGN